MKTNSNLRQCTLCRAVFEPAYPTQHWCDNCENALDNHFHLLSERESEEVEVAECMACHNMFLATEIMGSGVCVQCSADYAEEFVIPYDEPAFVQCQFCRQFVLASTIENGMCKTCSQDFDQYAERMGQVDEHAWYNRAGMSDHHPECQCTVCVQGSVVHPWISYPYDA